MSNFDKQYASQGGRCFWCQHLVPVAAMTRDHIEPKIHGGANDWSNIVLACARCNEAKSALHVGSIRFAKWLRKVTREKSIALSAGKHSNTTRHDPAL